jgi:hypothetical protein
MYDFTDKSRAVCKKEEKNENNRAQPDYHKNAMIL